MCGSLQKFVFAWRVVSFNKHIPLICSCGSKTLPKLKHNEPSTIQLSAALRFVLGPRSCSVAMNAILSRPDDSITDEPSDT